VVGSSAVLAVSFVVYSLFIIGVGLYSSRRRRETTDDFVLANRELGPWVSALSGSASTESGWVMLGLVGEAFVEGWSALWIIPGIAAGYLFNWFVIADRLRESSAQQGSVTLTQYLLHRFGAKSSAIRAVSVLIVTTAMLGYVAAQMNAAGKAFDAVFEMPYWIGVLVGAVIILTYTITGGFRAICWTDVVQASFMMVALIGMPIIVLLSLGGYEGVTASLAAESDNLLTLSGGKAGLVLIGFVVGSLGIGLGYPGQPHVLARFMAARDRQAVRKAGYIAFGWMMLVYAGAVSFGLFAHAYFGNLSDPEQALPLACSELLPPVLAGFVIAAIVSAICSTADSQLIVVSSTLSRDVFAKGANETEADRKRILMRDRLVLVVLGLISVFFALTENRVIFEFVLYAWAALGAAFGPPVILGLLWKKASRGGAIAGMVVGVVTVVVWKNIAVLDDLVYELVPAFIFSLAAVLVFSWLMPNRETTT
jgi:sodium/proline symporter